MPVTSLIRLLRPPGEAERADGRLHLSNWRAVLARWFDLCDAWLSLLEFEQESDRLANTAAINRWETIRIQECIALVPAPKFLAPDQRSLCDVLAGAQRAFQLLATGHRYHKSEAVCDGQMLLLACVHDLKRELGAVERLVAG